MRLSSFACGFFLGIRSHSLFSLTCLTNALVSSITYHFNLSRVLRNFEAFSLVTCEKLVGSANQLSSFYWKALLDQGFHNQGFGCLIQAVKTLADYLEPFSHSRAPRQRPQFDVKIELHA